MTNINKLLIPFFSLYFLGFNRGMNYYKHCNPEVFLYKNKIFSGFVAGIIYINPLLLPFIVLKYI